MTFTPEQMNKAKSAKSAEELLEMAKAEGVEMTAEEAAKYFTSLHTEGELNEDELATIAGGKQEYSVASTWAPTCGCYKQSTEHADFYSSQEMCGNCAHFYFSGFKLTPSTQGVCRRDYD